MTQALNIGLDEKKILQDLREFRKSTSWISQNLAAIRKEYPDRYIAVYNREVIDADEDFDKLFRRVQKKHDMSKVAIEFVPSREVAVVL